MKKNQTQVGGASPKQKYLNKPLKVKYIFLDELKVSTVDDSIKVKDIKNGTIRGVIKVQAHGRGGLVRSRFMKYKMNLKAAIRIQAFIRGCLARKRLQKMISPRKWGSPTKKDLSFSRDLKSMMSKVRV